ncbi:hypothetical protein NDI54_03695 [Haloarcula sp. S1AR25-5A]|uniref:Uncharacterized protein n=1 Tax=Haloarcula terrestris TaxID=2950533 RepID=A0AAE4EUW0_9EURY|nr:hypothetical protein [Haloarcula terrestris]MDS0220452.1 hypothetical protein [Haloarcula terrestris]
MSVLETVKQKVGITEEKPLYECADCGHEFRSDADPDSYWSKCPECESSETTQIE